MTLNSVRKQKRIKGKAIVPLALNDVDAERTVSHESAKSDAPGDREVGSLADLVDEVGVEQDAQPEEDLLAEAIKEAVAQLRGIRKLTGLASVRAALPPAHLLDVKSMWATPKIRALAMKCGFLPPPGVQRNHILEWIEGFRLEQEGDGPCMEPSQDAPPATVDLSAEDDEDLALSRRHELEEMELLAMVEEEKQASALAADSAVANQRKAERDALTATHDAKMKALRDGISASKRARSATPSFPFLEASKTARMDKGVARPPAPPLRPAGSEPAASPREVERPLGPVDSGEPPRVRPCGTTYFFFALWGLVRPGYRSFPLCIIVQTCVLLACC